MRPFGAALVLASLASLAGCGHPTPSVSIVGTWQAFLGDGRAAKIYYGRPEPTKIQFREDGTYRMQMMWGARSIAETTGTYRVEDQKIYLDPNEDLDPETWPGREAIALSSNNRSFTLRLPRTARVPEAEFFRAP